MKIKDYKDALDTLRIANMSYAAGAWQEAFDMLDALSTYVAYSKELPKEATEEQVSELRDATLSAVCQFHSCPDECLWEMSGNLRDRLD